MKRIKLKKPRVNGKRKGSQYERYVCQRLSWWVSKRTRTDCFWRSAMSGGRNTVNKKQGKGKQTEAHAGDVVATHETGNDLMSFFVMECKHHKDTHMDQL